MKTSFRHSDPAVQREFERIRRLKEERESQGTQAPTTPVSSTRQGSRSSSSAPSMVSGEVWVNELPKKAPASYPDSQSYMYERLSHTPENNKYGWAVYGIIEHNLNLPHKDSFVCTLVDSEYFDRDEHIDQQESVAEVEGLDPNRIIVRSVYKPTNNTLYFNENGELETNIKLYFTVIANAKPSTYVDKEEGWILTSTTGDSHWLVTASGSRLVTTEYNGSGRYADLLVLINGENRYEVTVDDVGRLSTTTTSLYYPMEVHFGSGQLTVTTTGILEII